MAETNPRAVAAEGDAAGGIVATGEPADAQRVVQLEAKARVGQRQDSPVEPEPFIEHATRHRAQVPDEPRER